MKRFTLILVLITLAIGSSACTWQDLVNLATGNGPQPAAEPAAPAQPAQPAAPSVNTPMASFNNNAPQQVNVDPSNPPFATKKVKEDQGRTITILSGFDMNEFGGDDNDCGRGDLDFEPLREEVGAPDEDCKIVLEWSLKTEDTTIVSGVFAMEPQEESIGQDAQWIRLTYAQANGATRFVGTIHYLQKGWNAHMYAGNVAADWQPKNPGLVTYVGLSPTDPWVTGLWSQAETANP